MRQMTYALIFSCCALTSVWGQATSESRPRLLAADEQAVTPLGKKPVVTTAGEELIDDQGRLRGTSVTERLEKIRRRAVDVDISKPFSVTGETDSDLIELHGALPTVPRRPIHPLPKRTSTRPRPTPPPQAAPRAIPKPLPIPAQPEFFAAQPELVTAQPELVTAQPQPEPAQAQPAPAQAKPASPPASAPQPRTAAVAELGPATIPELKPAATPEPKSAAIPEPKPEPKPEPMPVSPAQPDPEPAVAEIPPAKPQPAPVITQEIKPESDVLLSNQVPSLSFETAGPKRILIGREAKYRVSMLNRSKLDARDVIVTVRLPAWAEVTRTNSTIGSPQVEVDANCSYIVHWEMSQLSAEGKEDLTLSIVPRDSRPFDLAVGWTLAAAQSTTQIQVQEPKLEMSINGAGDVLYGETLIYTITMSNPGTGAAENVVLSLMPVTPQQEIAGSRSIGSLKEGERKTIELELTAHQAGELQVKAVATADGGLRAEAAQDVHVRRANLDIAIIGPPRNFAGTEATYKVRIENTGDATADQSLAAAIIPAGASYLASNDGGRFDSQHRRVEWHVGSLRPGAVRVLEFQCILESAGENRIDIQAQADGDLRVAKSVVTSVEALADLKLFVNDPKGPISVGQDSIYEVKIVNRGTKAAERIQVVGYFSEGIEPVDVRGWRGEVTTGQVTFEPIGSLMAGQELVFRITARADKPGNHVFRAEVECNAPETRLAAEEWTKYYGTRDTGTSQASQPETEVQQAVATRPPEEAALPELPR